MALILIVEDDDQVRGLAESILQEGGYQTLSAATVAQALALLQTEEHVDLVFTDIGLQSDVEAGLVMAQGLAKQTRAPVLYTTGHGLTDGMTAMFVERYGFLAKPYTSQQFLIVVENLLTKN